MLQGREKEIALLDEAYKQVSGRAQLAVFYGRRRIGKSFLIQFWCHKKNFLYFEALEHVSNVDQIEHFKKQLIAQTNDPLLSMIIFKDWDNFFDYLDNYIKKTKGKTILVFDEFQWMAQGKTKLVSLIKYYWDNHWKKNQCFLILCGSIASFMVKKVIHSKALYGRIDHELNIGPLLPSACYQILNKKRSFDEVVQYNMIFGGVPKYYELIKTSKSFHQNIKDLFFKKNSFFFEEFHKIFFSQFKEVGTYKRIVSLIHEKPYTLAEISKRLKIQSGGGLKSYLVNLELAGFVESEIPFNMGLKTKKKVYRLIDPFLVFYFKFILPAQKTINSGGGEHYFEKAILPTWKPWLGYAFERFCKRHAMLIASKMGFLDSVLLYGPQFNLAPNGFQFDLVFERSDQVITVCEIKFNEKPVDTSVVKEMEDKLKKFPLKKGQMLEKAIITKNGVSEPVLKLQYFHHILTVNDLL